LKWDLAGSAGFPRVLRFLVRDFPFGWAPKAGGWDRCLGDARLLQAEAAGRWRGFGGGNHFSSGVVRPIGSQADGGHVNVEVAFRIVVKLGRSEGEWEALYSFPSP
jgi:hypothetical protein